METLKSDNIKEIACHCWWVIQCNPAQLFVLYYDRRDLVLKFMLHHEPSWYNVREDPSRYHERGTYDINCRREWIEQDIQVLRKELKNVRIPGSLTKHADVIQRNYEDE